MRCVRVVSGRTDVSVAVVAGHDVVELACCDSTAIHHFIADMLTHHVVRMRRKVWSRTGDVVKELQVGVVGRGVRQNKDTWGG